MVFMPMSQNHADDVVKTVFNPRKIGQNQVDAGLRLFGEKNAAVDNQEFVIKLQNIHIAADLAQATQRDNPEIPLLQRRRFRKVVVKRHHAISVPRLALRGLM